MKRFLSIMMSIVVPIIAASAVWAAETKEEKDLGKNAAAINATAKTDKGEKVVVSRLEKEFKVSESQIKALRDRKLGYGEIAIALSLAQKMPGGITDANIQQIMTLRQGPPTMGWGEVAKKFDTKLGPTVSQVRHMNAETHREMNREAGEGKGSISQERHEEMHGTDRGDMGHGGGAGGAGMSHGKGK